MAKDKRSIHALRKVVVDGILLTGLFLCLLAAKVLWHPFKRGFFCGDESLMYPYSNDTVTVFMLRLVGLSLPLLTFLICEFALLRRVHDDYPVFGLRIPAWVRGFYCAVVSFLAGLLFTELTVDIAKNSVGRLRPHFFTICQPSIDCDLPAWRGRYIQPFEYNCTGSQTDKFRDMRMSFLSGHSAWAAFTMVYLAIYLQNRMSWRGSRLPRQILQFVAVMLSWYTALSRVSDYKHHWSDVVAGYFLGIAFACITWSWGTELVQQKRKDTCASHQDTNCAKHNQNIPFTIPSDKL